MNESWTGEDGDWRVVLTLEGETVYRRHNDSWVHAGWLARKGGDLRHLLWCLPPQSHPHVRAAHDQAVEALAADLFTIEEPGTCP